MSVNISYTEDRPSTLPDGIFSLLDTDLYKLTMQCCLLKYFDDVDVKYTLTNRTPDMKLNRTAVRWLQDQIDKLGTISLTAEEAEFLRLNCKYLNEPYIAYLSTFRFRPREQVELTFHPDNDTGSEGDTGPIALEVHGKWLDTILYEIPLLALVSESYFKFVDRDWSYEGQIERARHKAEQLCQKGCFFSEFGSRRRRDYHTHELVIRGLQQGHDEAIERPNWPGRLTGTSNVHFAMKHGIPPVGTVAHEFFMAVAAITNDYEDANETALRYWIGTYGEGVLGIALTDTFGTKDFLRAFARPIPKTTIAKPGAAATLPSTGPQEEEGSITDTKPPIEAPQEDGEGATHTYAQVFTGVRQDSGNPEEFVKTMRQFYDEQGIKEEKTIVFSDSLNVDLCDKYKKQAEAAGFRPSFGIGTFLTNDYARKSTGQKSVPLNIVIKISKAAGRPCIKISDNIGKNTGDSETVANVKQRLGYSEKEWVDGDEKTRWGKEGDQASKA
ncbi:nicotinate phosphoribosyltransferase [Rhizodiscina lignyota]|uniref:nicotinate phosphoribosyltransferase n=1 Tax=Rhizodiscina lignyota TaxID=1504668 RepID=A0A9P4IK38_9PEZI|nr:nicotinate phosphoribosyltransferase [Rhizodiscina lignyota]